jgi:hypothetical protein
MDILAILWSGVFAAISVVSAVEDRKKFVVSLLCVAIGLGVFLYFVNQPRVVIESRIIEATSLKFPNSNVVDFGGTARLRVVVSEPPHTIAFKETRFELEGITHNK